MRRGLLIVVALAVLTLAGAAAWVRAYLDEPLPLPAGGRVVDIPSGTSLGGIADQLATDGVLPHPEVFALYGRVTGRAALARAGEYSLQAGLTPRGLLDELVAGRVLLHGITFVEGWTVRDILRAIRAEPALRQTLVASDPEGLATELGLERPSAEGEFFPDTYRFPRGTTDRDLLQQARQAMQARLAAAWASRAPDLPLPGPYELLILASIVEKETALPAERPRIAGVFVRRLRRDMRLQTDPTVIYGMGLGFDGNLTRADLEADTPFNTYTRPGLPPTPIAAPGAGALMAAARPADGSALYFVATGDPDGSHHFSDTLDQHLAAVRSYLSTLDRRKGH